MGKRKDSNKPTADKRRKSLPTVGVDGKSIEKPAIQSSQASAFSGQPSEGSSSRPLRRRTTDEAVERCIQTKLQGVSRQAIETQKLPCGRLTRDKLSADIKATRGQAHSRLGATYWRSLRAQLGKADSLQQLKTDETLPVSKDMVKALEALCVINVAMRSPEAMLAWLQGCDGLNEREIIGIFKICNSPKKTTHTQAMQVVVATLRTLVAIGSVSKFEKVYVAAKDLIDQALTSSYNTSRKNGVAKQTWLEENPGF